MRDDVQFVPLTRRHLLALGGAGLAGLVSLPRVVGRESWLRRASYARRVGELFQVGGTSVSLRLTKVGDLVGTTRRGASLAGRDDAFILELTGPAEPLLPQDVYELRHRTLGRMHLFIVPHVRNTYAVVVNQA